MYSVVKDFMKLLSGSSDEAIIFSDYNVRTAIAVLYYRVILVDGRIRQEELEEYRSVLGKTLLVSEDELLLFEQKVLEAVRNENTLSAFTDVLLSLPEEKRLEILENMRQISISDRELHEFEINMVERTAQLLGLENWEPNVAPKRKN